jgi:2-polyprenyl-6-hydroxyphenyl methylase/3-demethylubiquinone-9 3-methyltransferase
MAAQTSEGDRFAFGKNWASYARLIDDRRVEAAVDGLRRLVGQESLGGQRFLDIGSGSGLHALAACLLGAAQVTAVDLDPESVETTRAVLSRLAGRTAWSAERTSVFDLTPATHGPFDIVYSWGVLHHTGRMEEAVACAARLVAPGGTLVLALYQRTPLCAFWKWEKRAYVRHPYTFAPLARALFKAAMIAGYLIDGQNPWSKIRGYSTNRGMDWSHDVHDWLGGWPYESISAGEMSRLAARLGFSVIRSSPTRVRALGLFGSGCDEYVLQRR